MMTPCAQSRASPLEPLSSIFGSGKRRSQWPSAKCIVCTAQPRRVRASCRPNFTERSLTTAGCQKEATPDQLSSSPARTIIGAATERCRTFDGLSLGMGTSMGLLLLGMVSLIHPEAAHAEGLPTELIQDFLDEVKALGQLGPALFIVTVVVAELIPLFPTQPIALSAGLLFGPIEVGVFMQGAAFMLIGSTLAAFIAFTIARRSGNGENFLTESEGGGSDAQWKQALSGVQTAIDKGGFWQQLGAITLLRLTPVAPFSASNYLLGMTPIALPAFVGGTMIGMGAWSLVFASIGGAGRKVLQSGVGLDVLLSDMGSKATLFSEEAGGATALAVLAAGGIYLLTQRKDKKAQEES